MSPFVVRYIWILLLIVVIALLIQPVLNILLWYYRQRLNLEIKRNDILKLANHMREKPDVLEEWQLLIKQRKAKNERPD